MDSPSTWLPTPPSADGTIHRPPAPVRKKNASLDWQTAAQPVTFEGLTFQSGLFYSSDGEPTWPGEPSAIDTSLHVSQKSTNPALDLGYYPSYDQLSAEQRRAYLEWLAQDRRDHDPSQRSLGYLFLAFYGFERRLLVDADRDPGLIHEVLSLLRHYGGVNASRSLRSYFLQWLNFAGWKQGAYAYRLLWPDLLEFDATRPNEEGMRLILANLHDIGEPLDWTIAYRVAMADETSRRSTVISRTGTRFWELFRQRYMDEFPNGMKLQMVNQPGLITYRPASYALVQLSLEERKAFMFQLRFANVAGYHRQFKKLPEIWNSCVEDLSGYSRVVASKKQGSTADLAAWNALPERLQQQEVHPLEQSLQELLTSAPQEGDYPIVPVSALAALLNLPQREKLTSGQTAKLVETLSGMGWFMAPPPQFTHVPLTWTQEVALYPRQKNEVHEPQIPGLVRLLYLSITLAGADGVIEDEELAVFNKHIAHELHQEKDWQHIRATEAVLRRDANLALRALPQIARHIPPRSKLPVFRTLIHIAAADGQIGLDELKILRRIARAFELEEATLDSILKEDVFCEVAVVTSEKGGRDLGERIPQREAADSEGGKVSGFKLDMDRLQALQQETHEVISMLSEVMDDPQEEVGSTLLTPTPAVAEGLVRVESVAWLAGLDTRYHHALLYLVRHDEVACEDFDQLASTHHLMPDDLLNAVNSWSDETLGDFLLERAENVRVFLDLLPPEATASPSALSQAS